MSFLIDTYSAPTDAELDMPGCVGAIRYISHDTGKCVTAAQVAHIHSRGKNVVLNFEDSATGAQGGYAQGVADGQFAVGVARSIGTPLGPVIIYSVDFAADADGQLAVVLEYFRGIQTAHVGSGFLVGVYGDVGVISAVLDAKRADLAFQTTAWSGTNRDLRGVLYQDQYQPGYDVDEIEAVFYGGWTPSGPQPNPSEDDMFTDADRAELKALSARIGAEDTVAFNIDGDSKVESIRTVLQAIRVTVDAIDAKLPAKTPATTTTNPEVSA